MIEEQPADELLAGGTEPLRRGFGSDNQSGVHPDVVAAIVEANRGHTDAYGDDPWTVEAERVLAEAFGAPCTVALVLNGTGANIVGLACALDPWSSIICTDAAHINTDECGAIEHVLGAKLIVCQSPDGKLTPGMAREHFGEFGSEHHREPKVLSISNLTEMGTIYTAEEIRNLADFAHESNMLLHVDGARISNAAASLGCSIASLTGDAGVDILSVGGTKNGLMGAEAVVLSERVDARRIRYVRKQNLQLASKQRFVAAQMIAAFSGDLYRECAIHSNRMAAVLATGAKDAGIELLFDPPGNEIFAYLPKQHVGPLQERFRFYTWEEDARPGFDSVRWVCSFDTTEADVSQLVDALKALSR